MSLKKKVKIEEIPVQGALYYLDIGNTPTREITYPSLSRVVQWTSVVLL